MLHFFKRSHTQPGLGKGEVVLGMLGPAMQNLTVWCWGQGVPGIKLRVSHIHLGCLLDSIDVFNDRAQCNSAGFFLGGGNFKEL